MLRAGVNMTPVDTGKAVSNWRVGVGQPTRAEVEAHSPGTQGSTASANRATAIADGESRINSISKIQAVYVSNNVSYLQYIKRLRGVEDVMLAAGRVAFEANKKVL
jgi:hypothetical protein